MSFHQTGLHSRCLSIWLDTRQLHSHCSFISKCAKDQGVRHSERVNMQPSYTYPLSHFSILWPSPQNAVNIWWLTIMLHLLGLIIVTVLQGGETLDILTWDSWKDSILSQSNKCPRLGCANAKVFLCWSQIRLQS